MISLRQFIQHDYKILQDTPPKIKIEPENDGLVEMIFLFLSGARILR